MAPGRRPARGRRPPSRPAISSRQYVVISSRARAHPRRLPGPAARARHAHARPARRMALVRTQWCRCKVAQANCATSVALNLAAHAGAFKKYPTPVGVGARAAAAPLKLDTVCDSPTPGRLTISEENCDDRVARSLGSQCEHPAADPPKPARLRLAMMSVPPGYTPPDRSGDRSGGARPPAPSSSSRARAPVSAAGASRARARHACSRPSATVGVGTLLFC